ncbi:hypothetical protein [Paenibacillus sp. FSL H7-0331]|uniref:hypothetical protein n=1 Tax=Paenibacillus sp. FSL H7-0331 TaxID=1920421 RepID=UPI0015C33D5F|nr:hypothetical protein [Paenibacillus sp. FSL H7-0331]
MSKGTVNIIMGTVTNICEAEHLDKHTQEHVSEEMMLLLSMKFIAARLVDFRRL